VTSNNDPTQQRERGNQEESVEKSEYKKINNLLLATTTNKNNPVCETRGVEIHLPSLTNYDDMDHSTAPFNKNGLLFDKFKKEKHKNYAPNNRSLIQKLISIFIDGLQRMKNSHNMRNNMPHAPQTIYYNDNSYNNNNKEKEKEQPEQIEIQTKSGYRIIIAQNSCSEIERIVIRDNSDSTSHNSSEEKVNSIEIDPFQNSVSIFTEMNLRIRARNVNIEANEAMNLKSGSIMTINGSLVKIN
jgi:hypothetical protein